MHRHRAMARWMGSLTLNYCVGKLPDGIKMEKGKQPSTTRLCEMHAQKVAVSCHVGSQMRRNMN